MAGSSLLGLRSDGDVRRLLANPAAACLAIVVGILAQSGGFFVHLFPEQASLGTTITLTGSVILVCAIAVLIYGMISVS